MVCSAAFLKLNPALRASPACPSLRLKLESPTNLSSPSAIDSSLNGSTSTAASPATSSSDEPYEVSTGNPQVSSPGFSGSFTHLETHPLAAALIPARCKVATLSC